MLYFFSFISLFIILTILSSILWSVRTAYKIYHPKRQANLKTPSDFNMRFNDFEVKTEDGYKIRGWHIPAKLNKVIIICHNINGTKAKFLSYAKFLNEAGFNVILFDFRSHGQSDSDRGFFNQALKSQKDIEAVIGFIEKKLEPEGLGMMGFSFGAIPCVYSSKSNNNVKAIVADSGPPDTLDDTLSRLYGRVTSLPRFFLENVFKMTVKNMVGGLDYDSLISEGIKNLSPKAIFFIHGLKDNIIPKESAEVLYEKHARQPKQLWFVPGSHHLTNYRLYKEEYERKVTDFFSKHLG